MKGKVVQARVAPKVGELEVLVLEPESECCVGPVVVFEVAQKSLVVA